MDTRTENLSLSRLNWKSTETWTYGEWSEYKLDMLKGMPPVPDAFRFDIWCYRTLQEARIGDKLHRLSWKVPM